MTLRQLWWVCMCTVTCSQFALSVVSPRGDYAPPIFWVVAGVFAVIQYTKAKKE